MTIQGEVLNIDSRASDLVEGDERWVEVDIGSRNYEEGLPEQQHASNTVPGQVSENQQERPGIEAFDLSTDDEPASRDPQGQIDWNEDGSEMDNESDNLQGQSDGENEGAKPDDEPDKESGYSQVLADGDDHNTQGNYGMNQMLRTLQGPPSEDYTGASTENVSKDESGGLGDPLNTEVHNAPTATESSQQLEGSITLVDEINTFVQAGTNPAQTPAIVPIMENKDILEGDPGEQSQATTDISLRLECEVYHHAQTPTRPTESEHLYAETHTETGGFLKDLQGEKQMATAPSQNTSTLDHGTEYPPKVRDEQQPSAQLKLKPSKESQDSVKSQPENNRATKSLRQANSSPVSQKSPQKPSNSLIPKKPLATVDNSTAKVYRQTLPMSNTKPHIPGCIRAAALVFALSLFYVVLYVNQENTLDAVNKLEPANVLQDHKTPYRAEVTQRADRTVLQPFFQTHFGKLPPEIREQIFIELLATPPSYAGHDFATHSSHPRKTQKARKKFVDIKASWYQVTATCRQIYIESHPIFFASKSYYLADREDLACFLEDDDISAPRRPIFRWDTITALCVNDLIRYLKLYTQEEIDDIFSDPTDDRAVYIAREQYEAMTYKDVDTSLCYNLRRLNSLSTVCLCIRVGEEMDYFNLLYGLSGMSRGLVEFLNASHWLIRPQNPEDAWRIQYACFAYGDFARGKDNEDIPYDIQRTELAVTDIDSRAPGLQEGDERYVEVQIQRQTEDSQLQRPPDENESDIGLKIASDHSDVELRDSYQAQLEIPQDQVEASAEAENSEEDTGEAELEPESNQNNQSPLLVLQSEDGPDPQSVTDTDQEEDHTSLGPASKEVSETQTKTQSDHQAENPPFSRSFLWLIHNAPTNIDNDLMFLTDTDDEDNQVQTETKAGHHTPQVADLQHNNKFHAKSGTEADQMQTALKDKTKKRFRRTKTEYLLEPLKQPLLDISDAPNPHTEEEMESYQKWQQLAISGSQEQTEKCSYQEEKPSSLCEKTQEHHVKGPCAASENATPKEAVPSPASPHRPGLPSKPVQIGAVSLLFLLLVIFTRPPGWLSNAHQDVKFASQQ